MKLCDALDYIAQTPKQSFRDDMQEYINQEWDAVPNLFTIEEETVKGSFEFNVIEAQISHVIDTATGQYKNGEDWRQLVFREINHSIERGRFYKFNDNYWLTTFTDEYNQITKDVVVRRCNNWLEWGENRIPCVIDYEATSSQPVTNESVNTPNSVIRVIVQGNPNTLGLDLNQKFLLGNNVKKRPYKIINYIDYLQNGIDDTSIPLVYLELQLIQKSSYDEIEPTPEPSESRIEITPEITEILQGRTVVLNGSVLVDGVVVEQLITCVPSGSPESNYTFLQDNNTFTITNLKPSSTNLVLTFTSGELTKTMEIKLRAKF